MKRSRLFLVFASLLVAGALGGSIGCTQPAPDTSCAIDDTVNCIDGTGYSCFDGDHPTDTNASLLCSYGVPGNAGAELYCCLHAAAASATSCGSDPTVVGCAPGSFGFSCADATEPPEAAYPELHCGAGIPGNAGSALYCCTD
ncbi:MAG TPA: hypothetical protein VGI39_27150 [Polyangiaceae bacterium]|jgi:hypothetical protein